MSTLRLLLLLAHRRPNIRVQRLGAAHRRHRVAGDLNLSTSNSKGTGFFWIDFDTCIDCGICLQVCPVAGAIVPEEKPELQRAA